jgi:hypothetical protein
MATDKNKKRLSRKVEQAIARKIREAIVIVKLCCAVQDDGQEHQA